MFKGEFRVNERDNEPNVRRSPSHTFARLFSLMIDTLDEYFTPQKLQYRTQQLIGKNNEWSIAEIFFNRQPFDGLDKEVPGRR